MTTTIEEDRLLDFISFLYGYAVGLAGIKKTSDDGVTTIYKNIREDYFKKRRPKETQ